MQDFSLYNLTPFEVDKDGDGKISEKEYKDALGVTLDELKKRARDEYAAGLPGRKGEPQETRFSATLARAVWSLLRVCLELSRLCFRSTQA